MGGWVRLGSREFKKFVCQVLQIREPASFYKSSDLSHDLTATVPLAMVVESLVAD